MTTIDERAITKYYFTLTGSPDIEIPITAFYGYLRDNEPSYLQIAIAGVDYEDEIKARLSGTLIIEMAEYVDSVENFKETIFDAFSFETLRIERGPDNQSITITGHKTKNFSPNTRNVDGLLSYRSVDKDGKCMYRIKPHPDIHPGDTIEETELYGDSFEAEIINYSVNENEQTMEIRESAT